MCRRWTWGERRERSDELWVSLFMVMPRYVPRGVQRMFRLLFNVNKDGDEEQIRNLASRWFNYTDVAARHSWWKLKTSDRQTPRCLGRKRERNSMRALTRTCSGWRLPVCLWLNWQDIMGKRCWERKRSLIISIFDKENQARAKKRRYDLPGKSSA